MRYIILLATVGAVAATGALAADSAGSISRLPDKGAVTISGTVAQVKNEHEFVLRDNGGAITVKAPPSESVVLKQGDEVTVNGTVERPLWGLMGKDIAATKVNVHKSLSSALSDAVTKTTGINMDSAKSAQISSLPDQGMVQLTGKVTDVESAKRFTLKDNTGSIDVSMKSDEKAILSKGADVTVIGYVDHGVLGKTLNATKVIVTADASGNQTPADVQQ